jgi:hypothetical protein
MNSMAASATFSGSPVMARFAGPDQWTEYRSGGAVTTG